MPGRRSPGRSRAIRKLAFYTFLAGMVIGALGPLTGRAVTSGGREVILISPFEDDLIEANKIMWEEGEPVIEIYGIAAPNEPVRILFPDPSKIIVPEEDPSLVLLKVDKQAGDNPLQARTVGYLANLGVLTGTLMIAAAMILMMGIGR